MVIWNCCILFNLFDLIRIPLNLESTSSLAYFVPFAGTSQSYLKVKERQDHMSPVKRICVFEHSVMTNFNCACPAIQRGQGSGFLSEGSS